MSTLESKIASFRSRKPLQPIPFELFPEFCQGWIQDYYEDRAAVRSQLGNVKEQRYQREQESAKDESKVSETKIRKQTALAEKVKLSGGMRLYGRISEDCIKLERGLKMLNEKMDRLEPEVKELEALSEVLRKNAAKYARPSAKKIAHKVTELEQLEKELLNVVVLVVEDEDEV